MIKRIIFSVLLIACVCFLQTPAASANSFTFATLPANGNISGPAGSTIGWGYTITNFSTDYWLMLTGLIADPFANGTPNSIFDYPILAPLTTVSVLYDPSMGTGLYQLTWDASAPVGFVNTGVFTVNAEWWTGNPFSGGAFDSSAVDGTALYSATVTAPSTAVPEPSTALLLVLGLAAFYVKKRDQSGLI